jgi:hypothetical protein
MKFKGFDDYVEIFKGGRQVDSSGKEHEGDAIIDAAVNSFNAAEHEPPAVIGHPRQNAPAYGWVQDLKSEVRNGSKFLLAKFRDVVPQFEEMVRTKRFKKRSAAFYPDGRLRHVGFLGAVPPAVKGLADIAFADDDLVEFEFDEKVEKYWTWASLTRILRGFREWLIEKEGLETADKIIPEYEIEDVETAKVRAKPAEGFGEPDNSSSKGGKEMDQQFSEADLVKAREEAAAEAREDERKKAEAEFAERERKAGVAARKAETKTWIDRMVKEGKLTPALVKAGVGGILEFLAESEDTIEFGEADKPEKATPFDRFKAIIEDELPKLVNFGEVAGRDKDGAEGGDDPEFGEVDVDESRMELHRKVKAVQKAQNLTYEQALNQVSKG